MSFLRRILISQDRDEIFVTIASYSAEYVRFLRGTGAAHQDILTLQEWSMDYLFAPRYEAVCTHYCGNLGRGWGRSRDRRPDGGRLMNTQHEPTLEMHLASEPGIRQCMTLFFQSGIAKLTFALFSWSSYHI